MSDLVERLRDPEFFARTGRREELLAAADEIERLRAALHNAFMAMCSHRDSPDTEIFQDAIDVLGMAAERGGGKS